MAGTLAQVWGMINGLQLIVHLPLVNVNFPQNAFIIVEKILSVATFDVPYVDLNSLSDFVVGPEVLTPPIEDGILDDYPEGTENLSEQLDELSYGSSYSTTNLGTMGFFLFATFTGFVVIVILIPFKKIRGVGKVKNKLDSKLKWNFTIRLFLEGMLEISFSAVITIRYVQLNCFGGYFNYVLAWILLSILFIMIIFIVCFYIHKFDRMSDPDDEEFHETFGAPYEGLKSFKKWSLFQSFWMCMRRIIFVYVVLHAY